MRYVTEHQIIEIDTSVSVMFLRGELDFWKSRRAYRVEHCTDSKGNPYNPWEEDEFIAAYEQAIREKM